jgi:hypothetical protein
LVFKGAAEMTGKHSTAILRRLVAARVRRERLRRL